jgi:hypothetical protein
MALKKKKLKTKMLLFVSNIASNTPMPKAPLELTLRSLMHSATKQT